MPAIKKSAASSLTFFFVGVVCVTLISLEIVNAVRERNVQLKEATASLTNVAFALAHNANETLREADIVLGGVVERLKYDGANAASIARTHQLLVMRVTELPQLNGIFIYDENGSWIVTSQQRLETNFNNSDREYFLYHRNNPGGASHIGPPIRSRSTGRWIFTISRRVDKSDGSFGGVVIATIDMAYLQKIYDQIDIGEDGAIVLGQLNGTMFLRRPLQADSIGKSLKDASIYRDYASKSFAGNPTIKSVQDGVVRINSYRRLDDYPMFITVAMAKEEVLNNWSKDTFYRGISTSCLLIVLAFIGTKMAALVKRREEAEKKSNDALLKIEILNKTLEQQAMQDGLTGLANRRHFDYTLTTELTRASRDATPLSLIMMDVDHFKLYNDSYGHLKGDECLKNIAGAVRSSLNRPSDLAARYGGEEFGVILPNTDASGALVIAEQIRASVRQLEIEHRKNTSGLVTISLGVSTWNRTNRMPLASDLIESADNALYESKNTGRDRVTAFKPSGDEMEVFSRTV